MRTSSKNRNFFILALMILGGGAVYLNSLNNSFHYDDKHHITGNPHIRSLDNIPRFFADPAAFSGMETGKGSLYRPMVLVSHTINYAVGGYSPVGYHLVNLGFHVGSAFLVFLIVQKMLTPHSPGGSGRWEDGEGFFAALAAGLIFLVHPFNSEVVNYISARSSVMCTFFYLLAFYWWVGFRSQESGVRSQNKSYFLPYTSYFHLASLLAFLMAMLTKEIAITLPVTLFLYDIYFVRGKRLLSYTLPYLPFLLGVVGPYLMVRKALTGAATITSLHGNYHDHLLTLPKVLFHYLRLLIFPAPLSMVHDIPASSSLDGRVLFFVILLAFVWTLAIWLYWKKTLAGRVISFFIFWFYIVLLPTTLIPLLEIFQENRGYIAGVSFAVIGGITLGSIQNIGVLKTHRGTNSTLYGFLLLLLVIYSAGTVVRNSVWKNNFTIWTDTIRKAPTSFRAHVGMASAYSDAKDYDRAEKEYVKALELNPAYIPAIYNLGIIYLQLNKLDLAVKQLEEAGRLSQYDPKPFVNVGNLFASQKEWSKAEEAYKKALQRDRNSPKLLSNLGLVSLYQSKYMESISYLKMALLMKPDWREVEVMLAYTMEKLGRSSEAEAIYRKVAGDKGYQDLAIEVRRHFSETARLP